MHGEAGYDCADGDQPCRSGRSARRPAEAVPPDGEPGAHDTSAVPAPRTPGPSRPLGHVDDEPTGPTGASAPSCRTGRAGWVGAHRHGGVRPRTRAGRRERPPRRWC
jgi:hypothetical protein